MRKKSLKSAYCVVLVTVPAKGDLARRLSSYLLKERLCACVNVVGGVRSFFWWKARVDEAKEKLLLIKTKQALLPALTAAVKRMHSYDVCEVIALPVIAGSKEYLDWVGTSCR